MRRGLFVFGDITMALGIGTLLGGVGTLAGLFQKKPRNPYEGQLRGAMAGQQGMAGQYGQQARQYGQALTGYNTNANASYQGLKDTLTANPYTDTYTTALRNQALGANNDAARQAQAALSANMAARGLSGSGMEAGALSGILGQQLAANNTFNNNLAIQGGQQHQQNLSTLYGLDTDRAQTAYQQQQQALGNQANLNGNVLALLAQLSGAQNAQNAAMQQQQAAGLGSLGSLLPGLLERTRKTGTPPISEVGNSTPISGYQPVSVPGLGYRFR